MKRHVFISYSSPDSETAHQICRSLERAGIVCWIAPRDIRPGEGYGAAIINGIDDAFAMVLVYSLATNDSPHVLREVERAVSKHTPIIPFMLESTSPSKDFEYFFSSSQWLDASDGKLASHLPLLSETLLRLARQSDDQPAEVDSPQPVSSVVTSYSPMLLEPWAERLDAGNWAETIDSSDEVLLRDLRVVLTSCLESKGFCRGSREDVAVALMELVRNVANHAASPVGRVEIAVSYKFGRFMLSVVSSGNPFTLEEALTKYDDLPPDQRRIHGLQNLRPRGQVTVTTEGGESRVQFQCVLRAEEESPGSSVVPFELQQDHVRINDQKWGYREWADFLGLQGKSLIEMAGGGGVDWHDLKEQLYASWRLSPPVAITVVEDPPTWTLNDLEIMVGIAFGSFIGVFENDERFIVRREGDEVDDETTPVDTLIPDDRQPLMEVDAASNPSLEVELGAVAMIAAWSPNEPLLAIGDRRAGITLVAFSAEQRRLEVRTTSSGHQPPVGSSYSLVCEGCGQRHGMTELTQGSMLHCSSCGSERPVPDPGECFSVVKCPGCRSSYDLAGYPSDFAFSCTVCGQIVSTTFFRLGPVLEWSVEGRVVRCLWENGLERMLAVDTDVPLPRVVDWLPPTGISADGKWQVELSGRVVRVVPFRSPSSLG